MSPSLQFLAEKLQAVERQTRRLSKIVRRRSNRQDAEDIHNKLSRQLLELEENIKELQQQAKKEPQMAGPVLSLRNRVADTSYLSILTAPGLATDVELEQAIRFLFARDLGHEEIELRHEDVWNRPNWLLREVPPSDEPSVLREALSKVHDVALLTRPAGSRGDLATPAKAAPDKVELLKYLEEKFKMKGAARNEIALLLGEWGDEKQAKILREQLRGTGVEDENFGHSLISALTTIGGPTAVEALMEVAETGPKSLASVAISSLAYLSSGGTVALTEAPELPVINTPKLLASYKELAERLSNLSHSQKIDEYIQYKASQLLQSTIAPALRSSSELN